MLDDLTKKKEDKEKSKKDECPIKKYTIIKDGQIQTIKEENGSVTIYSGYMGG